jgi:hypothetical protein
LFSGDCNIGSPFLGSARRALEALPQTAGLWITFGQWPNSISHGSK